jgi:hypothetical protein
VLPGVPPGLADHGQLLAPLLLERLERQQCGVRVARGVDRFEVLDDGVVLAARHVLQAVADQVHDARLDRGLGEHGFDRFGEPFEAVDAADQDVLDAALFEVGEDLHPELRALVGLKPHPEHIALAVHRDRQREVAGTPLDRAAVADLQHHAIEEHDRVDVIQRPGLPGARVLHHRVRHPRDQVAANPDAVDLLQVRLDIARRQAPRIQGQDLVVEPFETPLTLAHDLRLEAPIPVTRGVHSDRPVLSDQRLRRRPVPGVARTPRRLLMGLITEVVGQLDLHRPLHQPLRELRQQPARPSDLLLRPGASEQLVDHLVGKQRLDLLGELRARGQRTARSASASLRSPSGLAALRAGAAPINGLFQTASDCR